MNLIDIKWPGWAVSLRREASGDIFFYSELPGKESQWKLYFGHVPPEIPFVDITRDLTFKDMREMDPYQLNRMMKKIDPLKHRKAKALSLTLTVLTSEVLAWALAPLFGVPVMTAVVTLSLLTVYVFSLYDGEEEEGDDE